MFLVELVAFLVVWPIMWWLGGRLAEDGLPPQQARRLPGNVPDNVPSNVPSNVIDLEQFRRRRHPPGRNLPRR